MRTLGSALAGSVLGQTRAAKGAARLLDKVAGAVLVALLVALLFVVQWVRAHQVLAVLAGLVLLGCAVAYLARRHVRQRAAWERYEQWADTPPEQQAMRFLYVWWAPLDPAMCAPGEVAGECVYVGQTVRSLEQRTVEHTDDKPWMHPGLTCAVTTHYATDEALDRAEREAIRTLHPRENLVHSLDTSRRTPRRRQRVQR